MTRVVTLTLTRCAPAALAVFLATAPASAACIMSYCKDRAATSRHNITDTDRRIIGDLYSPGHGRRIQIRDTDRRIIGYIEKRGQITETHRREVGSIESLRE